MNNDAASRRQTHNASRPNNHRACANCARLKMKCQWPASGAGRPEHVCVRCARMKLTCHVPEPTQRKRRGKSTRVAQLEQKIDGIVSLLAAGNYPSALSRASPLTPTSPDARQRLPPQLEDHHEPCIQEAVPVDMAAAPVAVFELHDILSIPRDEAVALLDMYRNDYVPNLPFVALPASMSPQALYAKSRFLFWAVMAAVAPMTSDTQRAFKAWFRRYMAEHIVVQQQKELEMLQAILVHLSWSDFHFYIDMQATTLIQLAMALVIDLRLDKPPGHLWSASRSLLNDAYTHMHCNAQARAKSTHTLDEMRAVLGLYHVTSLLSALLKRSQALAWTNHLAQCCDTLAQARDADTDLYLVALVRMQHVAGRIYSIVPGFDAQDASTTVYRAPLDMAIESVRKELEAFAAAQPEPVKQSGLFWAHYHVLTMRLYEPILPMRAPPLGDSSSLPSEPFQRTAALWHYLDAAVAFFTQHAALPASTFGALPFTSTGLLAFAVVTTSRLLLLDSAADWDAARARQTLDFGDAMRRLADRYDEADAAGRRRRVLDDGDSMYRRYSYKLRWIRQWYLARVPPSPDQPAPPPQQEQAGDGVSSGDPMVNAWADFQCDETFWQELMALEPIYNDVPMGSTPQPPAP